MGVKKIDLAKKFMQVEIDVKCMHTKFGGHGLSSFGDLAPFCFSSKQPNFPYGSLTVM